jgi:lipid A disaccharide synthetase
MKSLINIEYIGLVNLVLGSSIGTQPVVKEYVQPSYSDQVEIMVELNKIDQDESYRESIVENCRLVKNKLSVESTGDLTSIADEILNATL